MKVYKFTTEAEANTAQEAVYQEWKASKPEMPSSYWVTTVRWADVKKREDADEWFFCACEGSSLGYTEYDDDPSWYPPVEEI